VARSEARPQPRRLSALMYAQLAWHCVTNTCNTSWFVPGAKTHPVLRTGKLSMIAHTIKGKAIRIPDPNERFIRESIGYPMHPGLLRVSPKEMSYFQRKLTLLTRINNLIKILEPHWVVPHSINLDGNLRISATHITQITSLTQVVAQLSSQTLQAWRMRLVS
jgi:hypothetical protein